MNRLILKVTVLNAKINTFIHRYASFLNVYMNKRKIAAFFEIIDGGFLFITENFEYFQKIRSLSENTKYYQDYIKNHQKEWKMTSEEFLVEFGNKKNEPIIFLVETINILAKDIQAIMFEVFSLFSENIRFNNKSPSSFEIIFPNLTSYIDYVFILLERIQGKV